jgi:hypothetical protein
MAATARITDEIAAAERLMWIALMALWQLREDGLDDPATFGPARRELRRRLRQGNGPKGSGRILELVR